MRIAVWHNLPFGGASRALFGHLTALKEAGHYLEIWTSDLHSNNHIHFEEFGNVHIVPLNIPVKNLHGVYKNPTWIHRTKKIMKLLKAFYEKCAKEINSNGFDLVFVNSCSITYMPFIAEFLTLPSVMYLGEPYRWLYEASPENKWQAPDYKFYEIKKIVRDYMTNYSRRIQVRQEIKSAKGHNKLLVNSFYSKETVYKAYGIESEVCRLGIDADKFSRNFVEDKKDHIVSVGTLYQTKGADRAIYLLSKIKQEIRPKLYWISNYSDETYLSYILDYAQKLKVELIPLIDISDDELIEYVSKARFMIYTPRLEPLGLAPLEANACATYVIGIAEAGVRETITHNQNGFLIDGIDDETFVSYAEMLLENKELSISLGLKARSFVENNWSYANLKNNFIKAISTIKTKANPYYGN